MYSLVEKNVKVDTEKDYEQYDLKRIPIVSSNNCNILYQVTIVIYCIK